MLWELDQAEGKEGGSAPPASKTCLMGSKEVTPSAEAVDMAGLDESRASAAPVAEYIVIRWGLEPCPIHALSARTASCAPSGAPPAAIAVASPEAAGMSFSA